MMIGGNNEEYSEEIKIGDQFVWEPNLPHAICYIEVTGIYTNEDNETLISTCMTTASGEAENDLKDDAWNEESRFREAVRLLRHASPFQ